jgi:hypothetical protein
VGNEDGIKMAQIKDAGLIIFHKVYNTISVIPFHHPQWELLFPEWQARQNNSDRRLRIAIY